MRMILVWCMLIGFGMDNNVLRLLINMFVVTILKSRTLYRKPLTFMKQYIIIWVTITI